MESSTIKLLSNYMPMVQRYESQFASFNNLLSKTTLTGKISSLDIAENLFTYMEETQEKFENLQDKLIETILEQNFFNSYEEAETSVKIVSEILKFYFHNRHEDILQLANSRHLLDLCLEFNSHKDKDPEKSKAALETITSYLKKFGSNSALYKDILLYANDGSLLQAIDLGQKYAIAYKTKLSSVLETHKLDSYGEFYQRVDFYNTKEQEQERTEFFFVVPLRQSKEQAPIITLVLVINIQEEYRTILESFPYRLPQSNLIIIDSKNHILFSDNTRIFPNGQLLNLAVHKDYTFLEYRSKACMVASREIGNIDGFTSIAEQWRICRIVPLYIAFDTKKQANYKIDPFLLENSLLVTKDLDMVIAESENINEELGDVVINGEIIASKSHSYALNPILNNIRILSEEMNTLCVQSTEELQKGIYNALFNVVSYYSRYSVLMMDSLFKECGKDSNWIKNETEFKAYLSEHIQGNLTSETLANTKILLEHLKKTFRNFYNIILFDKEGNTLQNSLDDAQYNAKKISIIDRLNNSNIDSLITSNYEPTMFYDNKKTFLFYNVIKGENNRFLGGLLYVLDSNKIQEFLSNALPKEDSAVLSDKSEIFGIAFDSQKNILASTKEDFDFESYNLTEKFDFKNLKSFKKIIQIGQKHYLVCSEICNPAQSAFTEYTKRSLYVMIFVAVKEEVEEYPQVIAQQQVETPKD